MLKGKLTNNHFLQEFRKKQLMNDIKEENDFTYGTDDDPTMRRLEERQSVSGDCGEVRKGEKEGGPDLAHSCAIFLWATN